MLYWYSGLSSKAQTEQALCQTLPLLPMNPITVTVTADCGLFFALLLCHPKAVSGICFNVVIGPNENTPPYFQEIVTFLPVIQEICFSRHLTILGQLFQSQDNILGILHLELITKEVPPWAEQKDILTLVMLKPHSGIWGHGLVVTIVMLG